MRRRAFSMLELLVVLAILALLAALGFGAYARYRANLALTQSSQHLAAELTSLQTSARTFGQVQMRAGVELTNPPAVVVNNRRGTVECRIYEGSPSGIRAARKFYLLDSDTTVELTVSATNVCDQPLASGDIGMVMEVGITSGGSGPFQRLFTIPFRPDGTVALPLDTEPARIVFDNGIYKRRVELNHIGKVKEERI